MSLDPARLAALAARHGPIARVVVASVQGSAPREPGAAVLVWAEDQSGTIGGGALEYRAVSEARAALPRRPAPSAPRTASDGITLGVDTSRGAEGLPAAALSPDLPDPEAPLASDRALRIPLGPALGQCCGGAVTLLTEYWDEERIAVLTGEVYARPLPNPAPPSSTSPSADAPSDETSAAPKDPPIPAKVARRLEAIRNGSRPATTELLQGWLIEPLARAGAPLWIWGAGHVGRALVDVLAPLPQFQITWADTGPERFPPTLPLGVSARSNPDLPSLARLAPPEALHLILTYSHEIDLALCHTLLGHGFGWAGLIGSDTKWARFRSRLAQLGHDPTAIDAISCPIGRKSYGKHPQAIAIGVAADLLSRQMTSLCMKDATG